MYFEEIKVKYFSDKFNIGITTDKRAYFIHKNTPPVLLKPHYHQGQIKYYIGKKRVSQRQLNNNSTVVNLVIQDYCPF